MSIDQDEVVKVMQVRLKSENFQIQEFSLGMLGEWVGLCGDHAILKVKFKNNQDKVKESSFFVKLYPRVESIIEFIEWTGSFRKEIFIYKIFDLFESEDIKILLDCVPKCYLSINKKYLILENLEEQGYVSLDKHQVFDYDTVTVILEALAKFHASTLIYEEKKSVKLIDIYAEDFEETYYNNRPNFPNKEGIEAAITGVLNSIKLFNFPEKTLSGKNFRNVLAEVLQRVFTLAQPSKKFRNVICHGDMWATNLLIKHEASGRPIKCKLVDFQCGRYTPPAQDVMSVIHLTTSREFRKKYLYNFIGIYYTNLEKHVTLAGYNMKNIISFDQFLASCEEQKVFGMIQTATYFPLILLKSETVQEFFGNKENNKEALFVDRSILVRQHIDQNDNYYNRIKESIQDLKDYCDYL